MNKFKDSFKKVFSRVDTTLIFPPKEETSNKNFKGQTIKKKNMISEGPMPNPEEIYARQRVSE